MKRLLLVALFAFAVPIALPATCPPALAAPPKTRSGQIKAIDLWAGVVRRGKTAQVMYQVYDLLNDCYEQVNGDQSMLMEFNFRSALQTMCNAAYHRAHGLETDSKFELDLAEQLVKESQKTVRR